MPDKQTPGEVAEAAAMVMEDHKPTIKMEEASMADKQPSGEAAVAAMVVEDQKPAIEAAARFPVREVAESVAFVKELTARLDAFPDVRDGLVDLLVGLGLSGHAGDARAVTSRAAALLCSHPDVLTAFTAFLVGAAAKPVPLAVTRPRRAIARRISRPLLPPPEEEEEESRNGAAFGDPRVLEALAFLKQVGDVAGREVWEKFVEALDVVESDRSMAAGEVYDGVCDALGVAHTGLLTEFAARFLPGKQEWVAEERRRARNRHRAEARTKAAAIAADDDDRKPPRADGGDHRQHKSSGVQVTVEIVKKRRADERGDDYAPRARSKKPHAGTNGEPPCKNRAATRVVGTADARGNNGDKMPHRRGAPNGCSGVSSAAAPASPELSEEAKRAAQFQRFRELWVFYTRYSMLVGTMARAEELLRAAADGGGFPATVEEMFPRRESREFLAGYYGGCWGAMRAALVERGGTALKAVVESLRRKEAEAVAEEASERRRQDAERATERIVGLVKNRLRREERRRQRKDASDGGGVRREYRSDTT
ncbi:unnamed protein product [Urochloa decumbens]|uniref:Uncharacterized protein n=1 Tax=Urochloa decumbens TaxID=240449 RepID=A0ABC9GFX8_9POAL